MSKKLLKNRVISCFLLAVWLIAISRVTDVIKDKSAISSGKIKTYTLTLSDFETEGLRERSSYYISSDTDPQLIYIADGYINGMKFYMETTMPTGEIPVYYTSSPEEDFSERRRVMVRPVDGEENMYEFYMPPGYVHTLRIDPAINAGNRFVFEDFVVNPGRTVADYFPLNYKSIAAVAIYTGAIWALSGFILEIFEFFNKKSYKN